MFALEGRTAVVTGASSGIGRAMAVALAQAGATVVALGRDRARLDALHAEGVTQVVSADLAGADGVVAAITMIEQAVGSVDILVNAAGSNPRPPMDEQDLDALHELLGVNLEAAFLLGQHFAPSMAARGWGRIVNVGSQQQHRAFGNSGAYGVAKAALAGLTRSQSERWAGSGVCVNTVVPGLVETAMTAALLRDPERRAHFEQRPHAKRIGQPDDFAGVALFLCSDASAYVTGQAICVDGGLSVT